MNDSEFHQLADQLMLYIEETLIVLLAIVISIMKPMAG